MFSFPAFLLFFFTTWSRPAFGLSSRAPSSPSSPVLHALRFQLRDRASRRRRRGEGFRRARDEHTDGEKLLKDANSFKDLLQTDMTQLF
ncbi:hypothetical protein AOLI_G00186580 [Acnodon oligacanthus]